MFDGFTPDMLLGKPTIHVPFNFIVQNMEQGKVVGVFQTAAGDPLLFGSKKTHQLIIGDAFFRPKLVFESNAFRGHGLSGLAMHAFMDMENWIEGEGNLLFERK